MFSRPDFDDAVSDIQALLAGTRPEAGEVDSSRLAETWREVVAEDRAPARPADRAEARRRTWWPRRPQRRHRRLVISCVALPVLLGATAAGWAIAGFPPASSLPGWVVCYSTAHRGGHNHILDYENSTGRSPVGLCTGPWKSTGRVPRSLVACALPVSRDPNRIETGEVGVYPDTTCTALGLPKVPSGYDLAARRFTRMERELHQPMLRCLSLTATIAQARRVLVANGLPGWRISTPRGTRPQPNQPPEGCFWDAVDSPAHAIQVIPKFGVVSARAAHAWNVAMAALWTLPVKRCQPGQPQQNGAVEAARVRAALRRAGLGYFKVVLGSYGGPVVPAGHPAQAPCYAASFGQVSNLLRLFPTNEGYGGPHQVVTAPPTMKP